MMKLMAIEAIKCAYVVLGMEIHFITKGDDCVFVHFGKEKPIFDKGYWISKELNQYPLSGNIVIEEFENKKNEDCILGFDL